MLSLRPGMRSLLGAQAHGLYPREKNQGEKRRPDEQFLDVWCAEHGYATSMVVGTSDDPLATSAPLVDVNDGVEPGTLALPATLPRQ